MRKTAVLLFLLIGIAAFAFAQESDEPPIFDDWDIYTTDLYAPGDQVFVISLGTFFPTLFLNNFKKIDHNISPPVGGIGTLSYNYFLNAHIFIGGELGGMFASTLADHMLYLIPLGVRGGYQFYFWRFEFPVTLTIGMVWQRYLSLGYYGFFLKGGGSAFYRFNSDWSFGLNVNWGWFPQWTSNRSENVDGNMLELTLAARYHF